MLGQLFRNLFIAAILLALALSLKFGWLAGVGVDFRPDIESRPWLRMILDAIINGLPVVIILDVFLKWNQIKQVDKTIVGTLLKIYGGGEQEIFSQLPDEEKRRIVRKSVVNILGDEYGSVLFDEILAPYLSKEINYRDHFQYHIKCYDAIPDIDASVASQSHVKQFINMVEKEHIWVRQHLSYTRRGSTQNRKIPHLIARFAFTQDQLNQFIVTDELFFREIIRAPDAVQRLLFELNDDQISEFFHKVLGLRVFSPDGETALKHSAHWVMDDATGQKFIEVRIVNPSNAYQGSGCRLEFTLPHRRTETEFLVTMPVPTKSSAEISFEKSAGMECLSYIPFISSFRRKNYEVAYSPASPGKAGPEAIAIRLTGWSFPTSGLVFVWK